MNSGDHEFRLAEHQFTISVRLTVDASDGERADWVAAELCRAISSRGPVRLDVLSSARKVEEVAKCDHCGLPAHDGYACRLDTDPL